MSQTPGPDLVQCADEVAKLIQGVFASLSGVERHFRRLWEESGANGAVKPSSTDFSPLAPVIRERLLDRDIPLHGAGALFAPGALRDVSLHLEWWEYVRTQTVQQLSLDFNPASDRYYDYTSTEWFNVARNENRSIATGPYVDLHGADTYIFTFSRPVFLEETFVGVVGADFSLAENERHLTAPLKTLADDAAIVTAEGRVLAASTPRWTPGTLFRCPEDTVAHGATVPADAVRWEVVAVTKHG